MEATPAGAGTEPRPEPPARTPGIGADAPQSVEDAARGREVDGKGERDALDYLLGATKRPTARVPVTFWTDRGDLQLFCVLHALDGRRIEQIDAENRQGDGPFAKLDKQGYNVAVLVEAIEHFENADGTRRVKLTDEAFIGGVPGGAAAALEIRFKYQPGLLDTLVAKVNDLSAYNADRVGGAQRVLVDAAGNS